MQYFSAPKKSLGDLDAEAAANLIATAADLALIVDGDGVIQDVAVANEDLSKEQCEEWRGRRWEDTVTIESRPKVEALLRDAAAKVPPRWRQINHPSPADTDLPVLYSAIQVGKQGSFVIFGRELRILESLQQRLVDAQLSMEQEYAKLRHAETRYRLLFQIASEAVLIVDASNLKVVEANPAAGHMLSRAPAKIVGNVFPADFDEASTKAIQTLLSTVRATGQADPVGASSKDGSLKCDVSASLFRQENTAHFLVRLTSHEGDSDARSLSKRQSRLLQVMELVPDGFVVTDLKGRILTTNRAFLDLVQLGAEQQAVGESLDKWLGRSGVDFNVIASKLRDVGSVRLFGTSLRGEYGTTVDVEISAVAVPNGEQPCLGFMIRDIGRRLPADGQTGPKLPQSTEQIIELVGKVPLKQLVQETTDLIERLCIEAALELTGDNRASAAEVLGLSRQSLYAKLHRYGLGELTSEGEDGK